MTHYEIYFIRERYEIWKYTNNGITYRTELYKTFKTRKGAENWARKQWDIVRWC